MIKKLAIKSFGSLFVRLLGSGSSIILTLIITNGLSASSAGKYFLAFSVFVFVGSISTLGLTNEVLRKAAYLKSEAGKSNASTLLIRSVVTVFIFGLLFGVFLNLFSVKLSVSVFKMPGLEDILRVFSLAIPFYSVLIVTAMFMQGRSFVLRSIFFQFIFPPLFASTLLFFFEFEVLDVVIVYAASLIISAIAVFVSAARGCAMRPNISLSDFLMFGTFPLFFIQIFMLLNQNLGQFLLGIWAEDYDVAIFSVSKRLTMLMSLILAAVNSIVAPRMAECFRNGDMDGLRIIAAKSMAILLMAGLPVFVIIIFFSGELLSFFGDEYNVRSGVISFGVLAFGQLINVITGTVAYLLIVTKNENAHNVSLGISVIVTLIAAYLFKGHGVVGISIAVSSGMIVCNILSAIRCKSILNINVLKAW